MNRASGSEAQRFQACLRYRKCWGVGFGVPGLGFGVSSLGLGFGVSGWGFRVGVYKVIRFLV